MTGQQNVRQYIEFMKTGPLDYERVTEELATRLTDRTAIDELIGAFDDPEYDRITDVAIEALTRVGGSEVVQALLATLPHKDPHRVTAAIITLGELRSPAAIDALIMMLDHPNEDIRCEAVKALEKIGDTRAVEPLLHRLQDASVRVQSCSANALGSLGDVRVIAPLIQRFETALMDEEALIHTAIIEALEALKSPPALEYLIKILTQDKLGNYWIRAAAAMALGTFKDKRAVGALINALQDVSVDVRVAAAKGLGHIGDPDAVDPLIAVLIDESSAVRKSAAESLGELGDQRALLPLAALQHDHTYDLYDGKKVSDVANKAISHIRLRMHGKLK
jgi:HEAT repeat protein